MLFAETSSAVAQIELMTPLSSVTSRSVQRPPGGPKTATSLPTRSFNSRWAVTTSWYRPDVAANWRDRL